MYENIFTNAVYTGMLQKWLTYELIDQTRGVHTKCAYNLDSTNAHPNAKSDSVAHCMRVLKATDS